MPIIPDLRVASGARGKEPLFGRDATTPSEVGVFVPPEVLRPGTAATEEALLEVLSTLSRDDTLFHCARINTIASGPGDFDLKGRQQRLLSIFCTSAEIEKINNFARAHSVSQAPTVFFRGQLLELMRRVARHCKNLPGDGTTYHDPAVRSQFVKAALIASMLWSNRTYSNRISQGGDTEILRRRALGAFRKAVEESGLAPHFGTTLGRGWSLFHNYLPKRYPRFHEEFEQATQLTLEQYMICVAALDTYTIFDKPDGPLFVAPTIADATAFRDIFPRYLALESQSPEQLATGLWDEFPKFGYRPLRERPVMITQDGRGVVLDPTLYSERISIGPLFHILAGVERGKANEIFGAFGLAFEDYATDILRRIYPSRPGLVDRVDYNVPGSDGGGKPFEVDALLTDATEAVIFEMKAAWLRDDTILNENYEVFLNHVRAKYGTAAGSDERAKGVAQLARIIGAIARGEWKGRNGELAGITRLYPVLVVHDARLDAPALGNFLLQEFAALIGPLPEGRHVAPLTIMTISDLEMMESSVGQFSLCGLLRDYARECPDRVRSFHNFVAFSSYGPKMRPSADLIRSSTELVGRVQAQLFRKS